MGNTFFTFIIVVLIIIVSGLVYVNFIGDVSTIKSIGKSSISNAFHTMIDPLSPDYIDNAETNCASVGGDWKDSRSALGCFNIEEDFDTTNCEGTVPTLMENLCTGLSADWTCTSDNAGCEY